MLTVGVPPDLRLPMAALFGAGAGAGGGAGGRYATDAPITLAQVRGLGELVTLTVPMEQTLETRLDGYLGGTECWVHARGEVHLGTDLTHATLDVDEAARRVTLTLPPPRPLAVTLDSGGVRVLATRRRGLWPLVTADAGEARLVAEAVDLARRRMLAAITERHLAQARGQTERVLQALVVSAAGGASGGSDASGAGGGAWACTVAWADP